jgi:hypothetical protein
VSGIRRFKARLTISKAVLNVTVRDRVIDRNPALGVPLPRTDKPEIIPLTAQEVYRSLTRSSRGSGLW